MVLDRHFILLFKLPAKRGQTFELLYEANTYETVRGELADCLLTEYGLLLLCKDGKVLYQQDSSFSEAAILWESDQKANDTVFAAEASVHLGMLSLCTVARNGRCSIIVCLDFDDAFTGDRDSSRQSPVRLVACFSSLLRDPIGNPFEV